MIPVGRVNPELKGTAMRERENFSARGLALALCAASCLILAGGAPARARAYAAQGGPGGGYKPSEAEAKAAQAVGQAADAQAALAAAEAFVKKYAKSPLRARVGLALGDKIRAVADASQRATLAEGAAKLFDRPEEIEVATPLLVGAYADAKRYDDAFRVGGEFLGKHPEDVQVLTQLGLVGIDQVRQRNTKFAAQGRQYSAKAVELIEADKRPAGMDDAAWSAYKTRWLPLLYQSLGMMSYIDGDGADARAKLEKAVALGDADPTPYALLADMADTDYASLAKQANALGVGAPREAAMQKAQAQLDKVIDMYAQAVAMTEGKAGYEPMHEQLLASLTTYYKYRKGSTEGMQQLIDKYKKTNFTLK
jgi:hypothetical protein